MVIMEMMVMVEVMVSDMAIVTMTTAADGNPQVTQCARPLRGEVKAKREGVMAHSHRAG